MRVWPRSICCVLLALGAAAFAGEAAEKLLFDRWYVLLLGERRAGWSHQRVLEVGQEITTESETEFTVQRAGQSLRVFCSSRFLETPEGTPIRAESAQTLGTLEMRRTMSFSDGGIELVSTQGGQTRRQQLPAPSQSWLTPQAVSRRIERDLAAGSTDIGFWTLDPSLGPQPLKVTARVTGPAVAEVFGKAVPAIAWQSSVSIMPGVIAEEYVDQAGRPIRSAVRLLPGLELTMLQADEALARSGMDPPELMAATLLKPNRPIVRARALRQAVYELRMAPKVGMAASRPAAALARDLPQAGFQRVVWGPEGVARVVVDLDEPVNPGADLPGEGERSASVVVDGEDPRIQQLAREALASHTAEPDALQAEALRQFVHRFVKRKDLSVGFATASEVARTAQGDCTEHAVLLAALLRAAKIPSRTVSGLLYVDSFLGRCGVFGYHMWTQAWVTDGGARWVDLDATLTDPFDAAHIALSISNHEDPSGLNDLVRMAAWLGGMEVKVIEVSGP